MKLIVFGATGKTGQHVWRQALEQGQRHGLRALGGQDRSQRFQRARRSGRRHRRRRRFSCRTTRLRSEYDLKSLPPGRDGMRKLRGWGKAGGRSRGSRA